MRKTIWIAAGIIAPGLLTALPAKAADNLQCVLALRSAEVDRTVFEAFRAGQNIGQAVMEARGTQFIDCRNTNKWSDAATESAAHVILGDILSAGVVRDLEQLKLPTERLVTIMKAYVAGLGAERMRKLADGGLDPESADQLVTMLETEGVLTHDQITGDVGARLGEYLSAYCNSVVFRELFRSQ